jgi:hypothetical protein
MKFQSAFTSFLFRQIFFLAIVIFYTNNITAQNRYEDSVLSSIATTKDAKLSADKYNSLANYWETSDYQKSILYATKALKISLPIAYYKGIANAYIYWGNALYYNTQVDSALKIYTAGMQLLEQKNVVTKEYAVLVYYVGFTVHEQGNTILGRQYYEKARKLALQLNEKKLYGEISTDVASDLYNERNFNGALKMYFENLKFTTAEKDTAHAIIALWGIAWCYGDLNNYALRKEYDFKAYHLAVAYREDGWIQSTLGRLGDFFYQVDQIDSLEKYNALLQQRVDKGLGNSLGNYKMLYTNMAKAFGARKDFANAELYYYKALWYCKKNSTKQEIAILYSLLSKLNMRKGDLPKALKYCDTALYYCKLYPRQYVEKDIYGSYMNIYKKMGDYKNAFEFSIKARAINDSILTMDNNKQIAEMQAQYDVATKENQIIVLNASQELSVIKISKQKQQLIYLIAGIALTGILLVVTIRGYRNKQKANLLLSKQKQEIEDKTQMLQDQARQIAKLQSQMNPHFIFNAINSVQRFVLQENKTKALDHLNDFAKLMRMTLNNSDKELITLKEERSFLQYYLQFEALRYNDQFKTMIQTGDGLDEDMVMISPMIVQPYVENAIKHGLASKEKDGLLEIIFSMNKMNDKVTLQLTIKDNGIGRAATATLKEQATQLHQSKGMDITAHRIQEINKKYSGEDMAAVNIVDLHDNGHPMGTLVIIQLPYIEQF